jgi:NADH dehydrogenase
MADRELHVVTGAFGYSGRYIASRLLNAGSRVRTITNHPDISDPMAAMIEVRPMNFVNERVLVESLRGASVLHNTYWVRFNHSRFTHSIAVDNTLRLFEAAVKAGVRRIVHVSINNPSEDSPLDYFRGKARLERALRDSGLSYAILRPPVLFGREDVLINNIAWFLRRFPIFGVFGDGNYRLQPIYVDDLAALAVEWGRRDEDMTIEAIGPETFTYRGLVETIGRIIGRPRRIIEISPELGYRFGAIVGKIVGDVPITRDEIEGLMAGLLYVENVPPAGKTMLTEWASANARFLGCKYASELARRR